MQEIKVKPGYKMTELGVIPEDWNISPIKDICEIKTGGRNTQDKIDNGKYPFFVRSQTIERINSYSFDGEAVLTAGDGVGTGKIFHYINGKFDYHQRVYKMSHFQGIDGYYFYLYFSNNFYNRIMQMTAKSSVDSVRLEMIADMEIPVPKNKNEQKLIAQTLSDTDELINSLDELIEKKEKIKEGTMQELLTGKRRLPGFDGEWEEKKLGDICDYQNGKSYESYIVNDGKYNLITLDSIDINGKLKNYHKRVNIDNNFLIKGDLIMILSDVAHGNFLGLSEVIPEDNNYLLNQRVGLLRIKNKNNYFPYFLSKLINKNQKYFKKSGKGSSQQNLGKGDILNFRAFYPLINEQKAIAEVLSDMDNEIENLKSKRDKYKEIKEGMMQELLTGKTRLV